MLPNYASRLLPIPDRRVSPSIRSAIEVTLNSTLALWQLSKRFGMIDCRIVKEEESVGKRWFYSFAFSHHHPTSHATLPRFPPDWKRHDYSGGGLYS
jgi:hypothetical protein